MLNENDLRSIDFASLTANGVCKLYEEAVTKLLPVNMEKVHRHKRERYRKYYELQRNMSHAELEARGVA